MEIVVKVDDFQPDSSDSELLAWINKVLIFEPRRSEGEFITANES